MNIRSTFLCALVLSISSATVGHTVTKCFLEKSAYDRAVVDYNRTEQMYSRLQMMVDSKYEQGAYRLAALQGNVEFARANLTAAQQSRVGQGFRCFFRLRLNCLGSAISGSSQRIAYARAQVTIQEARLAAFQRAYDMQMTRLSQRVTEQGLVLENKKDVLTERGEEYQVCLRY
ncbi:MAG: hypothetical protein RIS36_1976 [Pseudomonadota bacterium]|jgi:hypothetical protein